MFTDTINYKEEFLKYFKVGDTIKFRDGIYIHKIKYIGDFGFYTESHNAGCQSWEFQYYSISDFKKVK